MLGQRGEIGQGGESDVEEPAESNGVVIDRGGLRVLDTRELEWQEHGSVPGGRSKELSYDADGEPTISIVWYPAGRSQPHFPGGIYHKASREFAFFLGGELPHWEFGRADDAGVLVESFQELVVFKAGFYMDRRPKTVHGLGPESSRVGCEVLTWRTAGGTFVSEDRVGEHTVLLRPDASESAKGDAARESRAIAAEAEGTVVGWDDLTILDTRAMRWRPHPQRVGTQQKVLSRDAEGQAIVSLAWLPPEPLHAGPPVPFYHDFRELTLVLQGELRLREFASPSDRGGELLTAGEGYYLDRSPGSVHCLDVEPSVTGCVLLTWRTIDAVFVNERSFQADRLHPTRGSG